MTAYISVLPLDTQREIARALKRAGIQGYDLCRALNSRVCDLTDTIDVSPWV